jgi:hypothetical protein
VLSVGANAGLVVALSHEHIRSLLFMNRNFQMPSPPPVETVLTILAEPAADTPPAGLVEEKPRFARTSEDQRGERPEKPAFIGERDTTATSDRAPDPTAPDLPSQAGIEPRDKSDIETTESDYQDGELATDAQPVTAAATLAPEQPAPAEPAESGTPAAVEPPEDLVQGPNPVDVPVPELLPPDEPKPTPPEKTRADIVESPPEKQPAPDAAPAEAGFRGYQRKTAVRGSISRTGRSSLDVADSPLGRYQALVSRAVELEWQRNCVRHRDFITPGFLTVRFHVNTSGKVRSVEFVGEMETGEIQKGFTLNSIRNAAIPPMPPALRREFGEDPLELIFNFYF